MTYIPIPNPLPITGVVSSTQGTSPWVTTATIQGTTVVSGVISATQGTSPWVVSAAAIGATQGTSPWVTTATVQGTAAVSLAAVSATQGTSPWVVSAAAVGATQATSPWVTTASGVLGSTQGTSPWVVSAAAVGATQSGNWTARIVGNAGGIVDAVTTATTAPANGLAYLVVATTNTVTSTLSNGQSIAAQCDYVGNLFTRPFRRSQITPASIVALATTGATTLFTAGATGVFRDISSLVITPIPVATTSFPVAVTISDGTNSYVFNVQSGSAASTAGQTLAGTSICATFNPPIPQAVAATTWTIKQSVTTVTCSVVALAVQSMIN